MSVPISSSFSVKSTLSAAGEVCDQIIRQLRASQYSEEDIFAVHLALEEAFVNAVKHGNGMDVSKQIRIAYSINSEKAEISITDEGTGFEPDTVPDPRYGENLYKAEGRGLFLIKSFMDSVEFNPDGNEIKMLKLASKKSSKSCPKA